MLDENQLVTVKWYSGNKKYFTDLGYNFTKMNDTFKVPLKLVEHKSKILVKVKCDYCGKEYETTYYNYKISESRGKIACKNCKQLKIRDTLQKKYGANSLWEIPVELYGKDNCHPGYPVDKVNLDCLVNLNGEKIDVEYDGLYWHRNTQDYDRKRNHWLISLGYKVLRIKTNKNDDLPTINQLKNEVDYLMDGHSIGYIDMNN